jgi:hypothetical protein
MAERKRPTVANSGDEELIKRVTNHLGPKYLGWTPEEIAAYEDGGHYGAPQDPKSRAAKTMTGRRTAEGGSGPKS